jgi:hypothetical protein
VNGVLHLSLDVPPWLRYQLRVRFHAMEAEHDRVYGTRGFSPLDWLVRRTNFYHEVYDHEIRYS